MVTGIVTFVNFASSAIAIFLIAVSGLYIIYGLGHGIPQGGYYPVYENDKPPAPQRKYDPENDQFVHQERERKWWEEYHKNNPESFS